MNTSPSPFASTSYIIYFHKSSGTLPPPNISLSSSNDTLPLPSLSNTLNAASNLEFDSTYARSIDAATNSKKNIEDTT